MFDGEPLESVVREVSRYTSIEIELVDARLKTLLIGGQFQIGETDALLDVLQTGFGLKVSRISESHVQILAPLVISMGLWQSFTPWFTRKLSCWLAL